MAGFARISSRGLPSFPGRLSFRRGRPPGARDVPPVTLELRHQPGYLPAIQSFYAPIALDDRIHDLLVFFAVQVLDLFQALQYFAFGLQHPTAHLFSVLRAALAVQKVCSRGRNGRGGETGSDADRLLSTQPTRVLLSHCCFSFFRPFSVRGTCARYPKDRTIASLLCADSPEDRRYPGRWIRLPAWLSRKGPSRPAGSGSNRPRRRPRARREQRIPRKKRRKRCLLGPDPACYETNIPYNTRSGPIRSSGNFLRRKRVIRVKCPG